MNVSSIHSSFSSKSRNLANLELDTNDEKTAEYAQTLSVQSFLTGKEKGGTIPNSYWLPNENSSMCYECGKTFSLLVRKHHCRMCGMIFCNTCSSHTINNVRVCNYCYTRNNNQDKNTSLKQNKNNQKKPTPPSLPKLNATPSSTEGTIAALSSNSPFNLLETTIKRNKNNIWGEETQFQYPGVSYSNYSLKSEDQIRKRSHPHEFSTLKERRSSEIPLERLQKSNSDTSMKGEKKKERKSLQRQDSEADESLFDDVPRNLITRKPSKGLALLAHTDYYSSPIPPPKEPKYDKETLEFDDETVLSSLSEMEHQYSEHITHLVKHLTKKYKLSVKWVSMIINLATQAVRSIRNPQNKLNILEDVKVKLVAAGEIADCTYYSGYVFSKFITNKNMDTMISNPRLMLFNCSISFEREHRFTQLDTLMVQEEKFLKLLVDKIVRLQPNLIIASKFVSSYAMKLLLQEKITVITNVKPATLTKIARYSSSPIFQSTSEVMMLPNSTFYQSHSVLSKTISIRGSSAMMMGFNMGRTSLYLNKVCTLANGAPKSIIIIEGYQKELGCSIVLYGGSEAQLRDVKRILLFTIFAKYTQKMEISLIKDQNIQRTCLSSLLWDIIKSKKKLDFLEDDHHQPPQPSHHHHHHHHHHQLHQKSSFEKKSNRKQLNAALSSGNGSGNVGGGGTPTIPAQFFRNITSSDSDEIQTTVNEEDSSLYNDIPCDLIDQFTKYYLENCLEKSSNSSRFAKFSQMLSHCPNIHFVDRRGIEKEDEILQEWPVLAIPQYLLYPNFNENIHSTEEIINPNYYIRNAYPSVFLFDVSKSDTTPFNQCNIIYLHSLCCRVTGKQCIPFVMHQIHYTNSDDLTFGEFLTKYCFSLDLCKVKGCNHSIIDHDRTIIHDKGRLNFSVSKTEQSGLFGKMQDTLFWGSCSICNTPTPVVILSDETLNYSFGMWLTLVFHYYGGYSYTSASCHHSIFRDYTCYYMRNDIILSVSYEKCEVRKVSMPSIRLKYNDVYTDAIRIHELQVIQDSTTKVFQIIDHQLEEMSPAFKSPQELRDLQDLIEKRQQEVEIASSQLERIKLKSPCDINEINHYKRYLFHIATGWNSSVQSVISKYANRSAPRRNPSINKEDYMYYDPISSMYSRDHLSSSDVSSKPLPSSMMNIHSYINTSSPIIVVPPTINTTNPSNIIASTPTSNNLIHSVNSANNNMMIGGNNLHNGSLHISSNNNNNNSVGGSNVSGSLSVHRSVVRSQPTMAMLFATNTSSSSYLPTLGLSPPKSFSDYKPLLMNTHSNPTTLSPTSSSSTSSSNHNIDAVGSPAQSSLTSSFVELYNRYTKKAKSFSTALHPTISAPPLSLIATPTSSPSTQHSSPSSSSSSFNHEKKEINHFLPHHQNFISNSQSRDDDVISLSSSSSTLNNSTLEASTPSRNNSFSSSSYSSSSSSSSEEEGEYKQSGYAEDSEDSGDNDNNRDLDDDDATPRRRIKSYDEYHSLSTYHQSNNNNDKDMKNGDDNSQNSASDHHLNVTENHHTTNNNNVDINHVSDGNNQSNSAQISIIITPVSQDSNSVSTIVTERDENINDTTTSYAYYDSIDINDATSTKKEEEELPSPKNTTSPSPSPSPSPRSAVNSSSPLPTSQVGFQNTAIPLIKSHPQHNKYQSNIDRNQIIMDNHDLTSNFSEFFTKYDDDPNLPPLSSNTTPSSSSSSSSSPINIPQTNIDDDVIRDEHLPCLGRSPEKGRHGRHRVNPIEGLLAILPNLSTPSPTTLPLPLLQDASGLFFYDGLDGRCVVVNENEVGSLIAYALCSPDYNDQLSHLQHTIIQTHNENVNLNHNLHHSCNNNNNNNNNNYHHSSSDHHHHHHHIPHCNHRLHSEHHHHLNIDMNGEEGGGGNNKINNENGVMCNGEICVEHLALLSDEKSHIEISFKSTNESKIKCSVTIHYAAQFHSLRSLVTDESHFIESISRSRKWHADGGKSGSVWEKTLDERFVVKRIPRVEAYSVSEIAPLYFQYLFKAHYLKMPTAIAKILGFYTINYRSASRTFKIDVIVSENVFYDRKISKVYDLKGSQRNRFGEGDSPVLLDENLVKRMFESPLCVDEHSKAKITTAVWNDTLFLSSISVMDYSLIVGIDDSTGEIVVGIIDYIRQYTWDKQLEKWFKSHASSVQPTVISPKNYKERFRTAMWSYFITVPHKFTRIRNPIREEHSDAWDDAIAKRSPLFKKNLIS